MDKKSHKTSEKLVYWREKLAHDLNASAEERNMMEKREALYRGERDIEGDPVRSRAVHVRNIVSELIETQVSSDIPQPKVTAKRPQDAHLARMIEDLLKNELDRLPFEELNDLQERTVPLQGGSYYLVEWDSPSESLRVTAVHPRQVIPQDGVFTSVEDMDHVFLALPVTAETIERRFGVRCEGEEDPESRGASAASPDMLTWYIVYYRNGEHIGRFSWVNDTVLEDLDDYQARRIRRCTGCGRLMDEDEQDCDCGGTAVCTCEELVLPVNRSDGMKISGLIPPYRPGKYPLVLQRNVSLFGRLLGDSDADKIADQQNTIKRLSTKIDEKLMKAGSYITLPNDATIKTDGSEMKIIRPGSPAGKAMIDVYNMQADVTSDLVYLSQIYEEGRQIIGVTDSYQGRTDSTAISGRAKEFSASQAAGRFESKRVMKNAAYARLFELMFRFLLAYTDGPRAVRSRGSSGEESYGIFDRYDFLRKNAAGGWEWNDDFLFSVDNAATLSQNRERMWQETRHSFESGAFGDPSDPRTLHLFWTRMELLHYPGAAEVKKLLEEADRASFGKYKEGEKE